MWLENFLLGDMITMISREDDRTAPPPGTVAKAAPLPEVEVEVWPLTLFVTMVPPPPPEEDALPLNDEALQSKTPAIRFQNGEINTINNRNTHASSRLAGCDAIRLFSHQGGCVVPQTQ